jgi:hypothetical protein
MALDQWAMNNKKFLFLFYFSRHKLEFSFNNAQAVMIHEQRTSDHGTEKVLE